MGYPGPGYPSNNYAGGGYSASATSDLDHQFGDLDLDRDRDYGGSGRPRKYSTSEAGGDRPRGGRTDAYNPHGPPSGPYSSSMRSPASNMRASPNMRAASPNLRSASPNPNMRASPNVRAGELPYLPATTTGYPGSNFSSSPARGHANPLPRSTTPFGGSVYPPGHVLEGQPMSRSRPPSPMPGGPGMPFPQASPRMPGGMPFTSESLQLAAPEGFSRPVNMAVPFTPFPDTFVQGMNRFFDGVPRMPKILQAHDVLDDDWMRLMKVCLVSSSVPVVRLKVHLGRCTCVGEQASSSRALSRRTRTQKLSSRCRSRRSLECLFLFTSWSRTRSISRKGETYWPTLGHHRQRCSGF